MDVPKIPRYELIQELAHGSFGIVFIARDTRLGRVVAIKFLRPEAEAKRTAVKRFMLEAKILASLKHPNIVHVYDVGEIKGFKYIIMDYIEGRPFNQVIENENLSVDQILRIISMIARALHAAHQKGIIHRDIKPQNIIIDTTGKPWLLDFGIARDTDHALGETTLTLEGHILGTPAYMSPEQARGGKEPVDYRSDIFSLGVVLYHALTGVSPFQTGNLLQTINKITSYEFKPPRALNPDVSPALEAICLKAMARDKADRFSSALEMARTLEKEISDENLFLTSKVGIPVVGDEAYQKTALLDNVSIYIKERVEGFSRRMSRRYWIWGLVSVAVLLLLLFWLWPSASVPCLRLTQLRIEDEKGAFCQKFLQQGDIFVRVCWHVLRRTRPKQPLVLELKIQGPAAVKPLKYEMPQIILGPNSHLHRLQFTEKRPGKYTVQATLRLGKLVYQEQIGFEIYPTPVRFNIKEIVLQDQHQHPRTKWEAGEELSVMVHWQVSQVGSGGRLHATIAFQGPTKLPQVSKDLGPVALRMENRWQTRITLPGNALGHYTMQVILRVGDQKICSSLPLEICPPPCLAITTLQLCDQQGDIRSRFQANEAFTLKLGWQIKSLGRPHPLQLHITPWPRRLASTAPSVIRKQVQLGFDHWEYTFAPHVWQAGIYKLQVKLIYGRCQITRQIVCTIVAPLDLQLQAFTCQDQQGRQGPFVVGEPLQLILQWECRQTGLAQQLEWQIKVQGPGQWPTIAKQVALQAGSHSWRQALPSQQAQPGRHVLHLRLHCGQWQVEKQLEFTLVPKAHLQILQLECTSAIHAGSPFDYRDPLQLLGHYQVLSTGRGGPITAAVTIKQAQRVLYQHKRVLGPARTGKHAYKLPLDFTLPAPGRYQVQLRLSLDHEYQEQQTTLETIALPRFVIERLQLCNQKKKARDAFWPQEPVYFILQWRLREQGAGGRVVLSLKQLQGPGQLRSAVLYYQPPRSGGQKFYRVPFAKVLPGTYVLLLTLQVGPVKKSQKLYLRIRSLEELGWFREPMPAGLKRAPQQGVYLYRQGTAKEAYMVYIPVGAGGWSKDPAFYIDKYEVTFKQYMAYVKATGSNPPDFWKNRNFNKPNHPVVGVNWQEAVAYCRWAGKQLPTGAQWHRAAGGGKRIPQWQTKGRWIPLITNPEPERRYPWGNTRPNPKYLNYRRMRGYTAAVGQYSPQGDSPYGCADMAGNVWEWCQDRLYPANPFNPGHIYRMIRGGGFKSARDKELRIDFHQAMEQSLGHHSDIGFRTILLASH